MSELQLSLIVIGATIIGGVFLYNWVQERSLRKRLDQAFGAAPEDVLLPGRSDTETSASRVEPRLPTAAPARAAGPAAPMERAAREPRAIEPDPELDCVAEIEAGGPVPEGALEELHAKLADCGRPARVLGLNADAQAWEEAARSGSARYRTMKLVVQLVNRSGAANTAQLALFCDAARHYAARVAGRVVLPDTAAALKAARDLDAFCSTVDVAIGINVVADAGNAFAGARIRELAEHAGFKLEADGVFHWRDAQRRTLFTLDNQDPAQFAPDAMGALTTHGVTLTLDVPRVADGGDVLDRMLGIGAELAAALGGKLVDDNRSALSEAGIARIRDQLQSINAALAARGIPAGGERALRLFS